jgi:hypothetical protein
MYFVRVKVSCPPQVHKLFVMTHHNAYCCIETREIVRHSDGSPFSFSVRFSQRSSKTVLLEYEMDKYKRLVVTDENYRQPIHVCLHELEDVCAADVGDEVQLGCCL